MAGPTGNAASVRVGPGRLLIAALGSTEPTDLATAWDAAFVEIGYTDAGSTFTFEGTFEDVEVAEEYVPIDVLETARNISIEFAAAEVTALNLQRAFNGGTITSETGFVTFEPPDAGVATHVMLGWESDETPALERWLFRDVVNTGSVAIARQKAPAKATIPMTFRALIPSSGAKPFKVFSDDTLQV